MSENIQSEIRLICQNCGNDRTKMMDIVRAVQEKFGHVSSEAMNIIAKCVNCRRADVESVVTFYAFFSKKPKGKVVIRLCNDVVDRMANVDVIADAFKKELGINFGQTTPDGKITLEHAPCIGMSDQAPAALINDEVITYLSTDKVREIVAEIKKHYDPSKLKHRLGDGNNANELVHSCVHNGIRKKGPVIFSDYKHQAGLKNALSMSSVEVINVIKNARLRGRGGAGFPTGMKWQFTRAAEGKEKYIACNADEGEPGTFKDRVLLTECADMLFEGMTIAGYAIGAENGILYLRGEYNYLRKLLEKILKDRREKNLLGKNVLGKDFNFNIRIQMGAGAYICGEETSLLSSCEGLRGDPKTRPPFPAQKGYMGFPTAVNNVETLCCVTRILEMGAPWFAEMGAASNTGTKLLSISGDCKQPGVYEFPFGLKVTDMLKEVGAEDAQAVLVGGPSGQIIGQNDFARTISYDDLATGGAIVIFGHERNMIDIAKQYMEFFVEESCGYCTPCRVGNLLLKNWLDKILEGKGESGDLEGIRQLGESIKITSRCGLGQTSPNPVLTTLKNFRSLYESKLNPPSLFQPTFNIKTALAPAEEIAKRKSEIFKS